MLLENVSAVAATANAADDSQTGNLEIKSNDDATNLIVLKGGFSTSDQNY